jgi:glycosyltransferase involved in cell wall biosynthesis
MRICFFGDADSIHVSRWCNHFASLGHDIHLISFKDTKIEGIANYFVNAGSIDVNGKNWKVILKYKEIKKILNKIKPDIFHAHYATSYGFTGALCNYHPFIITALGSDVLISPKNSFLYKSILRFAFKRADWITVLANHMKEEMSELVSDPGKISIVCFGINPEIFNNSGRKVSDTDFVITSTRAFEPVYNIPYLIEAVELASRQIPNIRLNLIGTGSQETEMKNLVKEKGLQKITKFFGKCTQPEIANTLKESHLFVSVSFSDGNNISLNEAMACGNVCIASDIKANQQWIDHEKNGFLVPVDKVSVLAETIVKVCKNYALLSSRFEPINLKIIEERAIWANNMKKVEDMYLQLVKSKS